MNRIKWILLSSILIGIFSCQPQAIKAPIQSKAPTDSIGLSSNVWLSSMAKSRIDTIYYLARRAHQLYAEQDTAGAQIAYEYAFELVASFTDGERQILTSWAGYDSLVHAMNTEYDLLGETEAAQISEAEEIREDISDIEDASFPDSVLFGNNTVIDSSGSMPLTLNRKVRLAIRYFQTKGRKIFNRWLERKGRYKDVVEQILSEEGVPKELANLAMIESGFNPRAHSYARAVGMWQFISATGRYYGLRHNWWFDERKDFVKATRAAAKHLKDLNARFDDWYLAMAGYNCNPNRVQRNIRRYHTRDFWKLHRLPRQTRNYVPTFLAATIIAAHPEKFGFYIEPEEAVLVDSVTISESIDLNIIAKAVDTSYAFIKEINPAVLRWVSPPGIRNFTIYLPKGKRQQFLTAYKKIPESKKRSYVRHRIRTGESLSTIAQKYHTSMHVIKSMNKLRGNYIRAGKYLLIPVPQNKQYYYARKYDYTPRKRYKRRRTNHKRVESSAEYTKIIHTVKAGENLGGIAEIYHTLARKIRSWNGLSYGRYIYPKQKLIIYLPINNFTSGKDTPKSPAQHDLGKYYTVRRGDTLWDISKKYGISIKQILKANNMRSSAIRPGDRLKVILN